MLASYRRDLVNILQGLIYDGLAMVNLAVAMVLFAALGSYRVWDPSPDMVSDGPTFNLMGSWGAFCANFLFQWIGIGAFIVPLIFLAFFFHLVQRKTCKPLIGKGMGLCVLVSLFQPSVFSYPNALATLLFLSIPAWTVRLGVLIVMGSLLVWKKKLWKMSWKWRVKVKKPSSSRIAKDKESKVFKAVVLLPSLELLKDHVSQKTERKKEIYIDRLQGVLEDFGVKGAVQRANPGPIVTLYELEPAAGVKSSRVISLADDIARSMSALSARVAVISGKNLIGIELSNLNREMVYFKDLLASPEYTEFQGQLPLALGKDISGTPVIVDLTKMPHLLVAGTTGSGKSVGINSMILSLLYRLTPDQCKLVMIDPKMLELSVYDDIPHLLSPVITDSKKAIMALKWVVQEMENRYRLMSQVGVRHVMGYNQRLSAAVKNDQPIVRELHVGFDEQSRPIIENQTLDLKPLPFIVVVIDEMADLMLVAGKDLEVLVQRLAQMARAAGIHLIMATQRPSVDVITGTIKANFPTRISFQVTSKIDSRTILGEQGAEHLLGQGDMLYMAAGGRITRVHGPFVSDDEIEKVVTFLKEMGEPSYVDMTVRDDSGGDLFQEEEGGDALYRQAIEIIRRDRKVSISYLQRQLQIGYNRAARLVEQMEKEGVVSPANHMGKREIIG
jgi:S-DNA-T family DNA segregation ATPase FtsK/SpoIIIE